MQIGRKIYYEKLTGNVILETGERMGDVVETTTEQDFEMYVALQQYVPEQVGCVQLDYEQYKDNFGVHNYSVDIANNQLTWGGLIAPVVLPQQPTLEGRLANVENTLDILLLKQEGII